MSEMSEIAMAACYLEHRMQEPGTAPKAFNVDQVFTVGLARLSFHGDNAVVELR